MRTRIIDSSHHEKLAFLLNNTNETNESQLQEISSYQKITSCFFSFQLNVKQTY